MTTDSTDFVRHHAKDERMYDARNADPYLHRTKYSEPTACPDCGAVFHKGHWQWGEATASAATHRCPACERIHDRVPAGTVNISGSFYLEHKEEIQHLIRNLEAKEKAGHPLERIMSLAETNDGALVELTSTHLTREIGEALHQAYEGDVDYQYADKDAVMRVYWSR